MDTNPHIHPADVEPHHQGVVIEPYRGPLLANGGRQQPHRVALLRHNNAPLFAFDVPVPEWLAQYPEPPHRWFVTRWLHRAFRDDNDEALNVAKRGMGWIILALICFALITFDFKVLPALPNGIGSIPGAIVAILLLVSYLSPFAILISIPSALVDAIHALRNFRASTRPRLTLRLGFVTLAVGLIALGVVMYFVVEFAILMNDVDKYDHL